ncbi:MAG: hypothetical protein QG653_358 [Patescibacteria group bacterium]|nr:hypothetical protein [Patescibacteria group bacterium]
MDSLERHKLTPEGVSPETRLVKIGENPDGTEILKKFDVVDLKSQEFETLFSTAPFLKKPQLYLLDKHKRVRLLLQKYKQKRVRLKKQKILRNRET